MCQTKCATLPPGSAVSMLRALFQDVHVQVGAESLSLEKKLKAEWASAMRRGFNPTLVIKSLTCLHCESKAGVFASGELCRTFFHPSLCALRGFFPSSPWCWQSERVSTPCSSTSWRAEKQVWNLGNCLDSQRLREQVQVTVTGSSVGSPGLRLIRRSSPEGT